MTPYNEPMDIGEIYGNTFAITRRTLAGAGGIALLLLLVGGICYAYGNLVYIERSLAAFSPYAGVDLKTDQEAAQAVGTAMITAMLPMLGTLFIFVAFSMAAQTMITAAGWETFTGESRGLVRRSLGRPLVITFLQTIILGLVMVLVYLLFTIITWPMGDSGKLLGVIGPLLVFLVILAFTFVRVQNVVVEDRGPWHGIIASIARVKGNFWRVLGVLFMFGLVYAAGTLLINQLIVGDPFGTMGMAGRGGGADVDAGIAALTAAKKYITWPYMIANTIWNSLTFIILFNLSTVIYADLRARRGEFHPEGAGEEGEWEHTV